MADADPKAPQAAAAKAAPAAGGDEKVLSQNEIDSLLGFAEQLKGRGANLFRRELHS